RSVANVSRFAVIEFVVQAAIVTSLVKGPRNDRGRISREARVLGKSQLSKCSRFLGNARILSLTFDSEEAEQLVLDDRPTNRATKKLAAVGPLLTRSLLKYVLGIELLLTEEAKH